MAGIILQVLVAELAGVAVLTGVIYAIWTKATKNTTDTTVESVETKAAA